MLISIAEYEKKIDSLKHENEVFLTILVLYFLGVKIPSGEVKIGIFKCGSWNEW